MMKFLIILACIALSSCACKDSLNKDPQSKDYGQYTIGTYGNVKVQAGFAEGNR